MLGKPGFLTANAGGPHGSSQRRCWPLVLVLALCFSLPASATDDRPWRDRFRVFSIGAHYGFNRQAETFAVAVLMLENGADNNPLGYVKHFWQDKKEKNSNRLSLKEQTNLPEKRLDILMICHTTPFSDRDSFLKRRRKCSSYARASRFSQRPRLSTTLS